MLQRSPMAQRSPRRRALLARLLTALLPALLPALLAALLALPATAAPTASAPAQPTAPARTGAPAAWVQLDGRPVLEIRVAAGAQTPAQVARRANRELLRMAENGALAPEQLVVEEHPPYWMVVERQADGLGVPKLAVDERAARSFGLSQRQLAERYRDQLRAALRDYRSRHTLESWLRGTALAALVLAVYTAWLLWQRRLHRRLRRAIGAHGQGLRIGASQLLEPAQLRAALGLGLALLHWGLLLLVSYLLIPLLLGFFPPTQGLAAGLSGQLQALLRGLAAVLRQAIPGLLTTALILSLTALLVRGSNAWFRAVEQGRVRLPGFYPEWGRPTGRIAAVLIVMAGLVAAYPHIPGAGSRSFQGAGLFVGVLAALGSSAVATNVISGLMLIYTRGFREGDRVEINGVLGVVEDRALLVTRIRTPRNELVSIPNATVIGASVVNYSLARRDCGTPVAVATTVTIGYDVPWRQVHALLLGAAADVAGVCEAPAPFVLQTALNDFHISYELNAGVREVERYRDTLSELLAAIQDRFVAADVEILSPAYHAIRDGNARTVPRP